MIQSVEIFSLKGTRVGKLCINSYVEMRLFQLRWVTMDARDFQNLTHTAQNQIQLILIMFFSSSLFLILRYAKKTYCISNWLNFSHFLENWRVKSADFILLGAMISNSMSLFSNICTVWQIFEIYMLGYIFLSVLAYY